MKIFRLLILTIGLFFMSEMKAQCSASYVYTMNTDGSLTFTNLSTPSSPSVSVSYTWTAGASTLITTSLSQTVNIQYIGNGDYFFNLHMVEGNNQCVSDTGETINVMAPGCPLTCSLSAMSIYSVPTASFTSVVTGTTNSTTYLWDFGDGSTSTQSNPVHFFTGSAIYIPNLIVSNSATCSAITIAGRQSDNWVTICSYTPSMSYSVASNGLTTFTANNLGLGLDISWRFGDGDNQITWGTLSASHIYFDGIRTPTLLVLGPATCNFEITDTITITNHPCNSDASFTYTTLANGVVNFSKTAPTTDTNIYYAWSFGDGVESNLANVTHTYSSAGNYSVYLYSSHADYPVLGVGPYPGQLTIPCVVHSQINMNINNIPCVANASFNIASGWNPHQYLITPDYPYNVIASTWSWGDGSTTNGSSIYAYHTYSAAGSYDICLTVTTSCGVVDSSCVSQYFSKGTQGDMMYISVVAPEIQTGISKNNEDEVLFSLFPNPNNNGILSVKLNKEADIREIKIYDLVGKEVYLNSSPENQEVHSIDLTTLTNGIYFIQLKLPRKTVTSKFIISR